MFRRFCKQFSESFLGCWVILQLPCWPSKQGELLDNILQNLQNKWPPHPVLPFQFEREVNLSGHNPVMMLRLLSFTKYLPRQRNFPKQSRSFCRLSTSLRLRLCFNDVLSLTLPFRYRARFKWIFWCSVRLKWEQRRFLWLGALRSCCVFAAFYASKGIDHCNLAVLLLNKRAMAL